MGPAREQSFCSAYAAGHWLLEHWGQTAVPRDAAILLDRENVAATVMRYEAMFRRVAADDGLRCRLNWNNGLLVARGPGNDRPVIEVDYDWPPEVLLPLPTVGVFGYFLGEALVNGVRHSSADARLRVVLEVDPQRTNLLVKVRNEVPTQPGSGYGQRGGRAFGGTELMRAIARICGWTNFRAGSQAGIYELEVCCPVFSRSSEFCPD